MSNASQADLMEFMAQYCPDAETATFTCRADQQRRGSMEPSLPGGEARHPVHCHAVIF